MAGVEIRHRDTNDVIYSGDYESMAACVRAAVEARANLAGAYLVGANLAGANLAGACLVGANLAGANLARANLAGAYLARASLADANLAGANLAGAIWRFGFTLRRSPVRIAQRADGYFFYLLDTEEGGWRIAAGCRFFTPDEAWAHWDATRPDDGPGSLGAETRDILKMFELAMQREGSGP